MMAQGRHLRAIDALDRLDSEHIIAPPRAGRPVGPAQVDIAVLVQMGQEIIQRRQTGSVGAAAELAQKAALVVLPQPAREIGHAL